ISFLSTPPRPPRSTLFPYTTLFRSAVRRGSVSFESLRRDCLLQVPVGVVLVRSTPGANPQNVPITQACELRVHGAVQRARARVERTLRPLRKISYAIREGVDDLLACRFQGHLSAPTRS